MSEVKFSDDGQDVSVGLTFSSYKRWFNGRSGQPEGDAQTIRPSTGRLAPNVRLAAKLDESVVWVSSVVRPISSPVLREAAVSAVAFNPSGSALATAARDGAIRLWRPVPSAPVTDEFRLRPLASAVGVDGRRTCGFAAFDNRIEVEAFGGGTWTIPAAADSRRVFAAPGCRVFAAIDTIHGLWLVRSGTPAIRLSVPGFGDLSPAPLSLVVQFSPDGRRLAAWELRGFGGAAGLKGIAMWDTTTGALIAHVSDASGSRGMTAAFTSDSQTLVTVAVPARAASYRRSAFFPRKTAPLSGPGSCPASWKAPSPFLAPQPTFW